MALINCPECGKEISDKSKVCIHCGFPLKSDTICNINGIEYDLGFILDENIDDLEKYAEFIQITNCDFSNAVKHVDNILNNTQTIPKYLTVEPREDFNKPKCPTCNSTNIEKISLGKKAVDGAMFGIFSSNVRKTMHCKSCGYKW